MGLAKPGIVLTLVACLAGCLKPTFVHCPDTDCPSGMVCDPHGGCALPDQIAQCTGLGEGDPCMYSDRTGKVPQGACSDGLCLPMSCPANLTNCDNACVNIATDPAHCGGCGMPCATPDNGTTPVCIAGTCASVCQKGHADCDLDPD